MSTPEPISDPFYWVEPEDPAKGCKECGHGLSHTVAFKEGTEACQISTSYDDKEMAEDVCGFMNEAHSRALKLANHGR